MAYLHKRKATIDNSTGGILTNYQVLLTVDTASLVSAGEMQADGDDIHFTDSDDSTVLNYWIQTGTMNTSSTLIWVKVPLIKAGEIDNIYMYYGDPGASAESNGDNVFIFFDDFLGSTLDAEKWEILYQDAEASYAIASSAIRMSWSSGTGYKYFGMATLSMCDLPFILETRQKQENTGSFYQWQDQAYMACSEAPAKNNLDHSFEYWKETPSGHNHYYLIVNHQPQTSGSLGVMDDQYHVYKWQLKSGDAHISQDGTHKLSASLTTTLTSGYIVFDNHEEVSTSGGLASHINIDWVFVRKYAASEPSVVVSAEIVWKQLLGSYVKISGTWKEVSSAHIKVGSAWKTISAISTAFI